MCITVGAIIAHTWFAKRFFSIELAATATALLELWTLVEFHFLRSGLARCFRWSFLWPYHFWWYFLLNLSTNKKWTRLALDFFLVQLPVQYSVLTENTCTCFGYVFQFTFDWYVTTTSNNRYRNLYSAGIRHFPCKSPTIELTTISIHRMNQCRSYKFHFYFNLPIWTFPKFEMRIRIRNKSKPNELHSYVSMDFFFCLG